ncbi:MAG TPA: hypothetical protein VGD78_15345 [Chthoniobacterales bacterium]
MSEPETSLGRLDLNDHSEIAVYRGGKLVRLDTRTTRFFEAWGDELAEAIVPAKEVRSMTQAIFAETLKYRHWLTPLARGLPGTYQLCRRPDAKPYPFEGLLALAKLFADETFDCIPFKLAAKFPETSEYPPKTFGLGDEACRFADWHQGYLLALLRMGERITADELVGKTLAAHRQDINFMRRYASEADRGPRPMLLALRAFAYVWDCYWAPVRFFRQTPALEFAKERLGHGGSDISSFARVFYRGGTPVGHSTAGGCDDWDKGQRTPCS